MQMHSFMQFFTDSLVFQQLCQFLTLSELLSLSHVSKQLRSIVQAKCRTIIKHNNLNLIPSKTCIHQMRFYFDRCLTIHKNSDNQQTLICVIENQFKFNSTKSFQIGINFSSSLTSKKQAFIFKTQDLICQNKQNINKNIKNMKFVKRTDVCQVNAKSQNLLYLKSNGEIYMCVSQKKSQNILEKQQLLEWSTKIPIQKMQSSFNFSIFIPKSNIDQKMFSKYLLCYDIDLDKIDKKHKYEQNQVLMFIGKNNATAQYYMIVFQKQVQIQAFVIGSKQAYFIDQNYQCYIVQFQNLKEGQRTILAKLFQPFKHKQIVKLASGYNYYLALQRNIQKVQDWSLDDVCNWLRQIGFNSFVRISIVQKLDGRKLLTIDKNYMHNTLGITKPNMQQKFMMQLNKAIQNKNKSDQLFGWGKNQFGQLASNHANYINYPQKIKINCLKQGQHIDSIYCGWFQTYIRTQKGRIYKTIKNVEKKKKYIEKQQVQQKQQINQKKRKNSVIETNLSSDDEQVQKKNYYKEQKEKNKKKKLNQDSKDKQQRKKKQHHKKFEEEEKWIQCATVGKAFFVQGFKDLSFYLQCPSHGNFQPFKQKKLRTAKTIINKIRWDEKLNPNQFIVGYIDKQMGLIQSSVYELQTFQLNQNRIKYIKKDAIIVWDRDNKVDHIN